MMEKKKFPFGWLADIDIAALFATGMQDSSVVWRYGPRERGSRAPDKESDTEDANLNESGKPYRDDIPGSA